MKILIKRVYDPPDPADGWRVLVDRLWPRGLKKEDAAIDFWAKDLSPSPELRKWFAHEEGKFSAFKQRYRRELLGATDAIEALIASAEGQKTVTLVYAAKETRCNNAVVLKEWLEKNVTA